MAGTNREFCFGDRVCLRSVNEIIQPPDDVKASENYWLLVGTAGVVVKTWQQADFPVDGPRYLVKFDEDVSGLGLHCHNAIENSLWILGTDIVRISPVGE